MVSIFDVPVALRDIIERMAKYQCVVCGDDLHVLGKQVRIYLCLKHRRMYLDENY